MIKEDVNKINDWNNNNDNNKFIIINDNINNTENSNNNLYINAFISHDINFYTNDSSVELELTNRYINLLSTFLV